MSKRRVREQFTASAEAYATSEVHAKGLSLERLLELTQPEPKWRVLDVATGAGHTAVKFASHVSQVVASDITLRMLELTARMSGDRPKAGTPDLKRSIIPSVSDSAAAQPSSQCPALNRHRFR